MAVLETITSPADLKRLPAEQLETLAEEIRAFLVAEVSRSGGHLGPNLGVVELTIALHRVFDSPDDTVVFDTGHQSYVHKLLTGRQDFSTLRQEGGLAGYPSRAESEHDIVESSHASSSLSWADGISRAWQQTGQGERTVVAVIGDGQLARMMQTEAIELGVETRVLAASDDASEVMPSCRSPSEAITNTWWSKGEVPGAASGSSSPRTRRWS